MGIMHWTFLQTHMGVAQPGDPPPSRAAGLPGKRRFWIQLGSLDPRVMRPCQPPLRVTQPPCIYTFGGKVANAVTTKSPQETVTGQPVITPVPGTYLWKL